MTAQAASPAPRRREDIDTLRAIACIGLVSYHVVGSSSGSGLELPVTHWMARANTALADMRMPLFSFLSGLVFPALAGAGAAGRPPWGEIASKARRLLLPMAAVGAAFWALRDAMGYDQPPLAAILVLPFAHFWFLQAAFLIMSACLLGNWLSGGRGRTVVLGLGLAGAAAHISPLRPDPNVLSLSMACKLMPFFAAGYLAARWPGTWTAPGPRTRIGAAAGLALAVGIGAALSWSVIDLGGGARRAAGLALGLASCGLLLALRPRHRGLARLGGASYAVYLLHVFFTAGTLEALRLAAPETPPLLAGGTALAAGLSGPILAQAAILRLPVAALLVLGLRPRPAAAPGAPWGRPA